MTSDEVRTPTPEDDAVSVASMHGAPPIVGRVVVPLVVLAIGGAEVLFAWGDPRFGALAHTVLLLILLSLANVELAGPPIRRLSPSLVLALVPLLRILSFAIPADSVPEVLWYPAIGIPVFYAMIHASVLQRLTRADLGLRTQHVALQCGVALTGIPLGYVGYQLLTPQPLATRDDPVRVALAVVALVVFVGVLEELLFRGLIQGVLVDRCGWLGVVWSTLLFALVYAGTSSLPAMALMGAAGLGFGVVRWRSGSIWGAIAAHSLMALGIGLLWGNL